MHGSCCSVVVLSKQTAQLSLRVVQDTSRLLQSDYDWPVLICLIFIKQAKELLKQTKIKVEMYLIYMELLPSSVMPGVRNYMKTSPSPSQYPFLSCGCLQSIHTPHALFIFCCIILLILLQSCETASKHVVDDLGWIHTANIQGHTQYIFYQKHVRIEREHVLF